MNIRIRLRSGGASRAFSLTIAAVIFAAVAATQGCLLANTDKGELGVVRSEQADMLSSTALVALKVAKLTRGEKVHILKRESIVGPTYTEEWLNVRLDGDEETTGWVEARHIVSESVVKRAGDIAGKDDEPPAFAQGRLKVNQKLRLGPGRNEDVATMLQRGTTFDIIGKKQTGFTPEKKTKKDDDAQDQDGAAEPDATDEPEQTDTWYQVRLAKDSIIQGGWILAQSVSLEAPDEIMHLEGEGRRFVAWRVVSEAKDDKTGEPRKNYVTFMRRASAPDNVDFERVYCLFWDAGAHTYYAPYVDSELRGVFPISQRDEGGRKLVSFNVLNDRDQPTPVDLEILANEKGRMMVRRVTPPLKGERIKNR